MADKEIELTGLLANWFKQPGKILSLPEILGSCKTTRTEILETIYRNPHLFKEYNFGSLKSFSLKPLEKKIDYPRKSNVCITRNPNFTDKFDISNALRTRCPALPVGKHLGQDDQDLFINNSRIKRGQKLPFD